MFLTKGSFGNVLQENKSSIYKIDKKNFIVNNKFVSFDTDTPLLRMQQQMEDDKVWFRYESYALQYHNERLYNIWFYTKQAFYKRNSLPNLPQFKINNKRIALTENNYSKYLNKLKALNCTQYTLTKEEYAFYEFDKYARIYMPIQLWYPPADIYHLHNPSTAKYRTDSHTKLQAEFNQKYFS